MFSFCCIALSHNSSSQDFSGMQSVEFNTEYTPSIGEKIYIVKEEGKTVKKIPGTINGIKKNRDNSTYFLVEFSETPSQGAPVFLDSKVIAMVYRQSATGDLYEAIPVRVVLDFAKNLKISPSDTKTSKSNSQEKAAENETSEIKKYIESRDYDKAVKIIQEGLKQEPDNPHLHAWLGVVMLEKGNAKEAAAEFKKAVAVEPSNADFYNGLGYAQLSAGSFGDAASSFREAVKLNPKHADAHYGLGTAYVNLGDTKLATKEYTILKDINEKMADSLFDLILRGGSSGTK